MTTSISTTKDIDVTVTSQRYLKRPFRFCEKTIVVIHEDIVKQLVINDETWFEEEVTDYGILLKVRSLALENGDGKFDRG
jgi:hypothetical protein